MRLPVNRVLPLAALIFLNGCMIGGGHKAPLPPPAKNGPAADYPMVIGDPFTIGDVTYTPVDKLNYDAVGYASVSVGEGARVTGAHKTLPLPSYVEVTSLVSGKTILVRLEDRGPMSNDLLIELSPGAAAQLGVASGSTMPVRVRRVNPPEVERAMLRAGKQAPERMETPKPLVNVLLRKLNDQEPLARPGLSPSPAPSPAAVPEPVAAPAPKAEPASKPVVKQTKPAPVAVPGPAATSSPEPRPEPSPEAKPESTPSPKPEPAPKPEPTPKPAATPAPKPSAKAEPASKPAVKPAASGSFMVQAATFSAEDRAKTAAAKIGGKVIKAGKFWLMRLGPFATRAEAHAALAKAKAAGYSDARIQRAD